MVKQGLFRLVPSLNLAAQSYIDAILPTFTEVDNGKVLGVVNEALAWVIKFNNKKEDDIWLNFVAVLN